MLPLPCVVTQNQCTYIHTQTHIQAGFYCARGDMLPLPCISGEWSDIAQANCTKCRDGYYRITAANYSAYPNVTSVTNASTMNTSASSQVNTSATTSQTNTSWCLPCPEAFQCEPDAAPVPCPAGKYSPGKLRVCLPCEPGYFSSRQESS
jgi:hypothetical protein